MFPVLCSWSRNAAAKSTRVSKDNTQFSKAHFNFRKLDSDYDQIGVHHLMSFEYGINNKLALRLGKWIII